MIADSADVVPVSEAEPQGDRSVLLEDVDSTPAGPIRDYELKILLFFPG